jgi:hypothetical protein
MDDREAARRRLKERIRAKQGQRGGREPRMESKEGQVQDMLMALTGDDAQALQLAQEAIKHPSRIAGMMKSLRAAEPSAGPAPVGDAAEEEEDLPDSLK